MSGPMPVLKRSKFKRITHSRVRLLFEIGELMAIAESARLPFQDSKYFFH